MEVFCLEPRATVALGICRTPTLKHAHNPYYHNILSIPQQHFSVVFLFFFFFNFPSLEGREGEAEGQRLGGARWGAGGARA